MKKEVFFVFVFSPQSAEVQWRVIGFLHLWASGEKRGFGLLPRTFAWLARPRENPEGLLAIYHRLVVLPWYAHIDPLSWPLFQIRAWRFSLQGKKTNSASMVSTLRMRAPIYPVVVWRRWQHIHKFTFSSQTLKTTFIVEFSTREARAAEYHGEENVVNYLSEKIWKSRDRAPNDRPTVLQNDRYTKVK